MSCVLDRPPPVTIFLYGRHALKSPHIAQSAVVATRRDAGLFDQFGTTERFIGLKQCRVQLGCCRHEIVHIGNVISLSVSPRMFDRRFIVAHGFTHGRNLILDTVR